MISQAKLAIIFLSSPLRDARPRVPLAHVPLAHHAAAGSTHAALRASLLGPAVPRPVVPAAGAVVARAARRCAPGRALQIDPSDRPAPADSLDRSPGGGQLKLRSPDTKTRGT